MYVARAAWLAAEAAMLTRAAGDTLATAVAKDILREKADYVGILTDWLDEQGHLDKAVAARLKELKDAIAALVRTASPMVTLPAFSRKDSFSVAVYEAAALIGMAVPAAPSEESVIIRDFAGRQVAHVEIRDGDGNLLGYNQPGSWGTQPRELEIGNDWSRCRLCGNRDRTLHTVYVASDGTLDAHHPTPGIPFSEIELQRLRGRLGGARRPPVLAR